MDYTKRKKLSSDYQRLGLNISFSQWLKTMGIEKGRPKKNKKHK